VRLQYYKQDGSVERMVHFGLAHAQACARDKSAMSMRGELELNGFLESLHKGGFGYSVQVPSTCTSLSLFSKGALEGGPGATPDRGANREPLLGRTDKRMVSLCAPALAGMDAKLAEALPLLVPSVKEVPDEGDFMRYQIEYTFTGAVSEPQALFA